MSSVNSSYSGSFDFDERGGGGGGENFLSLQLFEESRDPPKSPSPPVKVAIKVGGDAPKVEGDMSPPSPPVVAPMCRPTVGY